MKINCAVLVLLLGANCFVVFQEKLKTQAEDVGLSVIEEIKNLNGIVDFEQNEITAVHFDVHVCIDADLVSKIAKLKSLKSLNLTLNNRNTADALETIGNLVRLESLEIYSDSISLSETDFVFLENLVNLKTLVLGGHIGFTDELIRSLVRLKRLEKLQVFTLLDGVISEKGMEKLAELKSLESLVLGDCVTGIISINDAGIEQIRNLKEIKMLAIGGSWVSDAVVNELSKLTKLETLMLLSTKIGNQGIRQLSKSPRLKELDLESTCVTDDVDYSGFDTLRVFDLAVPKLSEELLIDWVTSIDTLEQLRLRRLGDVGVTKLRKLNSLRYLDISGTDFDDYNLIQLSKIKSLQKVNLFGTRVTFEELVKHEDLLRRLRYLNLPMGFFPSLESSIETKNKYPECVFDDSWFPKIDLGKSE